MLAFADAFWVMGVLFLFIIPLMFLMKKGRPSRRPGGGGMAPEFGIRETGRRGGFQHRTRSNQSGGAPARVTSKLVIALVILVVAAVAGYGALCAPRWFVVDDANVDGHISAVAPKISGNVIEVPVVDNQTVKAGQVLVRIDPRDFAGRRVMARAALQQAESQLHSAQAAIPWVAGTTESGSSVASAQLADAQTEVERARLAYEQANSSDLAYAQANVVSTRQTTTGHRPTSPA